MGIKTKTMKHTTHLFRALYILLILDAAAVITSIIMLCSK